MSNKLLWELFEMVRELMPVTEANTRRMTEWAARFHADEADVPPAAGGEASHGDDDDEPEDEHPARHASRHASPKRKR